jgi:radical SAM superfamily enzyme YgiQ (UPF0313 family)
MMRIALIVPRARLVSDDREYARLWDDLAEVEARRRLWRAPHLGLLTVAALIGERAEVVYLDENRAPLDLEGRYDYVLLSPVTSQAPRAYAIAGEFRGRGAGVIIGGVHASAVPDEAQAHADAVVVGEVEPVFDRLWRDMEAGRARGRYQGRGYPAMAGIIAPRYDLADPVFYRSVPVQTSRGCPHACEFCATTRLFGRRYRRKSRFQVLREVEAAAANWRRPFLFFTDDNMFLDRAFAREFLAALAPLRLSWSAFSDASVAGDDELLQLMARSGCRQVLIGFESLDPENLRGLDRTGYKLRQFPRYPEIIRAIQGHGIGVVGSFVVGLDHDTPGTFRALYDFILENHLYATNITVVTPFPGTTLFARMQAEGRLLGRGWHEYTGFQAVFRPRGMSADELERGLAWLYQEINAPDVIGRRLAHFMQAAAQRQGQSPEVH